MEKEVLRYPYIRISPELHEKLANMAQRRGLIPHSSKKRRNLVNLGIEALLEQIAASEVERAE